jgi:hypothetical protein
VENLLRGLSVAIDSIGRIVVTGDTYGTTDKGRMFITRYLANGNVDTTFNGGYITAITGYHLTILGSSAIDSSDSIVVTGGFYETPTTENPKMFITRYLANGSLDTSFAGGVITKQFIAFRDTEGY